MTMLPRWERDKATAVILYLAEAARLERRHINDSGWWQAVRESLTAVIERMTRPLWRGSDRIERGTGNDHLPKD